MNQNLRRTLKQLRLSGLADTLEVRLQEASGNRLSHEEFLELLVQDEMNVRQQRLLGRRVKAAAFGQTRSLEDFDFAFNTSIKRKQVFDLSACHFNEPEQQGIYWVVEHYAYLRSIGHTREYAMASMLMKKNDLGKAHAPAFSEVMKRNTDVPASWLRQANVLDHNGTNYTVLILEDGPIVWQYIVCRNPDGSTQWVMDEAKDAQEFDPVHSNAFVEAERKAGAIIDGKGIKGLGTCHVFWDEEKRILQEEYGIKWKSPPELNPTTSYD